MKAVKIKLSKYWSSSSLISKNYLLLITVIFVYMPLQVFQSSLDHWQQEIQILIPYLSIFLILAIGFRLLKNRQTIFVSILFMSLSLIIMINDIISPLQISQFDGSPLTSTEPLGHTQIELLSAVIIIMLLIRFKNNLKTFTQLAWIVLLAMILVNVAIIVHSISTNTNKNNPAVVQPNPNQPNIYHIVLDSMQSDIFSHVITQYDLKPQLSGFISYPNNRSNYLYTHASLASFFTGTLYNPDTPYLDWQKSYNSTGILPTLKNLGYRITMFAAEPQWVFEGADESSYLLEYEKNLVGRSILERDFFIIHLGKIAPNFLSSEVISLGSDLGQRLNHQYALHGLYQDEQYQGILPFASVSMFDQLIESESRRQDRGEYVYFHAALPHAPYIVSAECEYTPQMGGDELDKYINQSVCGLHKVSQFLDTLKKLGRYDNSIIILHSDTGVGDFGYITNLDQKVVTSDITKSPLIPQSRWHEDWVRARTAAVLAIKPPSNQKPFQENPKATQLIDIAPTLFAILGVKSDQLPGSNIFEDTPPKLPITSFFWPGSEPDTVRSFDTYQTDQPINLQPYNVSN